MDADYEHPVYGWTATTTATSYNETLDLFYHRWQTGREREAQETFLEQSAPYLDTAAEQIQVLTGGERRSTVLADWRRSDAQVAASWDSFWDEESSFCYCPSPDTVCSLESISSAESVTNFSLDGEINGTETPSGNRPGNEDYSLLSLSSSYASLRSRCPSENSPASTHNPAMPPSQTLSGPSRTSRVVDPEDPNEGEDLDLPDSERPGLRPSDFGLLPSDRVRSRSPIPVTRTEPITVTLGNWDCQFTVIKPNVDYRDVPSPIMLPGSPPQQGHKTSFSGFYKVPSRRDAVDDISVAGNIKGLNTGWEDQSKSHFTAHNEQLSVPPSPALRIPERAVSFMNHPSNSDVSLLELGSPTQPMAPTPAASSPLPCGLHQEQQSAETSSVSFRGFAALASDVSIVQPGNCWSSAHMLNTRPPSQIRLRRREGIRPPVILSVHAPQGNDVSWSAPDSPDSRRSGTPSPGVVFKLDEELNRTNEERDY